MPVFPEYLLSITDADVDDILKKGEDETKALNDKLAAFADNARKFTLDGGMLSEFKVCLSAQRRFCFLSC